MFDNRRINRLILIFLVVASVFLFFSCGEPTFIYLPDIKITRDSVNSSDTSLSFKVMCKDNTEGGESNMGKIQNGPGLLISYILLNSRDSNLINPPVNPFNDGNMFSVITDFNNVSKTGLVSVNDSNKSIMTTALRYSDTSSTNYLVKLLEDSSGKVHGAPTYQHNFSTTSLIDQNLSLVYVGIDGAHTTSNFQLTGNFGTEEFRITNDDTFVEDISYYAVFFASFTSGSGLFSTPLFSELTYIGTITFEIEK